MGSIESVKKQAKTIIIYRGAGSHGNSYWMEQESFVKLAKLEEDSQKVLTILDYDDVLPLLKKKEDEIIDLVEEHHACALSLEGQIADLKEKLEGKSKKIRRLSAGLAGARSCIKHDLQPQVEFYRKQNRELEGMLKEIRKSIDEFLFEVQTAIALMRDDVDNQYYEKNIAQLNRAFLHYKKVLAVLLKEGGK